MRVATGVVLGLSLALAAGCGKSGHGAETNPEKASDAEALNTALARELTAVDVYRRGLPLLTGRMLAAGRVFLAQEQEDVDALTKAIRGLGGKTEAEAEELDLSAVKTRPDALALAYEQESASLAYYVNAEPHLYTSEPRSLVASLAAGHAQRLVVLRQGLGAGLAASVPEAFDDGEVRPPG